ncbi:pentatricopeptide repeat-containing protein At1g12775, mitochondrial-like isoform X1 [Amaranthus tricolor]|uniref:pentatricopeptide repeat-containing protein At1g12775, mitochondrial-like isoform X1 n=1 Tax=Amaranthus tricolor TaxID=29722 RepID=UPI00258C8250|nr:pentatricopeptide repeat-containing protein At1g12775, mitochondrial-like isoform X1 [Amaranthus tricolor]
MPCSLGCSSWPPFFLSNNSARNRFHSKGHHVQLKQFTSIINKQLPKTFNSSIIPYFSSHIAILPVSPFDFTITIFSSTIRAQSCCFASKSSALFLPEMKSQYLENNSNAKVKQLADNISSVPPEQRFKVLESVIENLGESINIREFNNLIMGLVMAEEMELALKLFDEMSTYGLSPDCWTYSVLIRCYCKKNLPDDGKKILDCMIKNGFRPNVVTLTILVNSLCSRGKIQRAFEVLEIMGKLGCNPNIQTYNCVLKGMCFVGRVEEAYEMLMDLKRKKGDEESSIGPDIYSYTAVMDGFCKVGRSDEAMELLEEAIETGLTPNVVTYNALFNGYCKEGKPRKGIQLLKQMKERDCTPDYISYSTLLHGLLKWGKFKAAFWVYNEMVEVGFKVDERMMNSLLRGLCRESWEEEELLKNVDKVYQQMKSWDYSIFPDTYSLVIQSFCIGEEIGMALISLHEMVEAGYFPRMVTVNRVVRGLCEEGLMVLLLSAWREMILFLPLKTPSDAPVPSQYPQNQIYHRTIWV